MLNKLNGKVQEENVELIEEAGELLSTIRLAISYTRDNAVNALTAYSNQLGDGEEDVERKEVISNILEGYKNELTIEKAKVLAKEFISGLIMEDIKEMTEEYTEMVSGVAEYVDTLNSNYKVLTADTLLTDLNDKLADITLPREEVILTRIENALSPLLSSDLSDQKTLVKFVSDAKTYMKNLTYGTKELVKVVNSKNDLLLTTAINLVKNGSESGSISDLLNVTPLEPMAPSDTIDFVNEVNGYKTDVTNSDMFKTFKDIIKLTLDKTVSIGESIKSYESILTTDKLGAVYVPITESLETMREDVNTFLENGETIEDLLLSRIAILQYTVNNVTSVYNKITLDASTLNSNMKILNECNDICVKVLAKSFSK